MANEGSARDSVRAAVVSLREVTAETVREICRLKVREDQNGFVAPNAVSIAQAYFCKQAWFRAVYADETPVGFLMIYDDPEKAEYFLWRFMIDARYQGKGYGAKAISLLVDHVRSRPGATGLGVSYVPEEGGPEPFYRKLGFVRTGEMDDDEVVARLGWEHGTK